MSRLFGKADEACAHEERAAASTTPVPCREEISQPWLKDLTAPNSFRHLSVIRESAERPLGKNQISIDHDLEDPVRTFDEVGRGFKLAIQFGRQPGGPRFVVSIHAIFDRNIHHASTIPNSILPEPNSSFVPLRCAWCHPSHCLDLSRRVSAAPPGQTMRRVAPVSSKRQRAPDCGQREKRFPA
jgi:hypothetical protein